MFGFRLINRRGDVFSQAGMPDEDLARHEAMVAVASAAILGEEGSSEFRGFLQGRGLEGLRAFVFEARSRRGAPLWMREFNPRTHAWGRAVPVRDEGGGGGASARGSSPSSGARRTGLPFPIAYSVVGILTKGREYGEVKRLSKASLSGAIQIATASRQKLGHIERGSHRVTEAGERWMVRLDPEKAAAASEEFERLVSLTKGPPAKRGPRASVPRRKRP